MGADVRRQLVRDARAVGGDGHAREDSPDVRRGTGDSARALGGEACAAPAGEVAGAFAALFYALNLTIVASDRTAREFPLLTVVELAQIIFLVRAQRRASWTNYLGIAIFTALMLPINYTASFLLAAEALWLGGLLVGAWTGSTRARELAIFGPGFAVIGGIALLAPVLPHVFISSRAAVEHSAVDWIKLQPATGRIRCCATWLAGPRYSVFSSP